MDLRLPLVVVQHNRRYVEAWVPRLEGVRKVGPSLSEMRDDLALAVMERFFVAERESFARYQLAPHTTLRHVAVDTVVQDRARRTQWPLKGRLGVLLEKWPRDDFYLVTPTRLPEMRFALRHPDELEDALELRLRAWALEHRLESLEPYHAEHREHLEVLEVDGDPPSVFPYDLRKKKRRPGPRDDEGEEQDEEDKSELEEEAAAPSPEEKENARRRRRLSVHTLRTIGRNLSHAAADGRLDRAFGREPLLQLLLELFAARDGAAVVLVGDSGVGKTAVVYEFARRLKLWCDGNGTRRDLWRVDGNRFIAGMSYVGQWEARARSLASELCDTGDILFADDLASLVFAGRHAKGNAHVAQFLEPYLARGELTVLAECTPQRFAKVRELAPSFAALFRVVPVQPLDDTDTLPVLLGVLRELEADSDAHPTRFAPAALETLLHLSQRYLAHEAFPGKAVRLLRSTLAQEAETVEPKGRPPERRYHVEHVYRAVGAQTGLPQFLLRTEAPRSRDLIAKHFAELIAGQPEAVEAMADVVVTMQHALGDPGKPLGTYLFVGPTGVGKTETAKALARYLFGDAARMVRFDMSEFSASYSVTRLVGHAGAPDGELTTALRTQPFCVVLFDELEKAHPRVFDALLQLLGEGRLTDAVGRTADARQCVVLMTSNLGVREAASRTGFLRGDADEARKHYVAAAQGFFRPEFFNRIDRVVPFRSLDGVALRVVVQHALAELLSRKGIRHGNVLVDVEPELLESLVEQAIDPRYGARPLKRTLERKLAVPLAHHLVRRRNDDLSLVALYRAGEELALSVAALGETPRLDVHDDASGWGVDEVERQFGLVRSWLDALRDDDTVRELDVERTRTLRALVHSPGAPMPAGVELLDRLSALREQADALDESELGVEAYEEIEVGEDAHDMIDHAQSRRYGHRYRGGLRPRQGFASVPVQKRPEVLLRKVRPRVALLRDELTVLTHQLEARKKAGEEHFVVLVEAVTPGEHGDGLLRHVLNALPGSLGVLRWWSNVGAGPWLADALMPEHRRAVASLRGFGLGPLLESLAGYALLEPLEWHGAASLGRIEYARADDALAWVTQRDARISLARERRRRGEAVALYDAPERITLRGKDAPGQRIVHAATGLAAGASLAVLAALLRAPRAGLSEAP